MKDKKNYTKLETLLICHTTLRNTILETVKKNKEETNKRQCLKKN